jgi:hypothetical protein
MHEVSDLASQPDLHADLLLLMLSERLSKVPTTFFGAAAAMAVLAGPASVA